MRRPESPLRISDQSDFGLRISDCGLKRTLSPNPQSAIRHPQSRGGFNLVEALVATMILSSAVLTLGAIGTSALSGTRLHRHYEVAAALIDKQLSLIDYMGIDQFIQTGQMEGIVEELAPGYQWRVTTEYQNVDNLYLVAITVSWLEGARPYRVTAQTMLDGTGAVTDTSTSTSTETGEQPAL
jgi:hypothetical protein